MDEATEGKEEGVQAGRQGFCRTLLPSMATTMAMNMQGGSHTAAEARRVARSALEALRPCIDHCGAMQWQCGQATAAREQYHELLRQQEVHGALRPPARTCRLLWGEQRSLQGIWINVKVAYILTSQAEHACEEPSASLRRRKQLS